MSTILLAGGAGYIGSHTAVELLDRDHDVVIADNFSNSNKEVILRIEELTGKSVKLYEVDTRSPEMEDVFKENNIDCVIDFAAYKSVGDSVNKPLDYYDNNLMSLISILRLTQKYGVNKLVFSSSATVYGDVEESRLPVSEENNRTYANPYGNTKKIGEEIIEDLVKSDPKFSAIILRYFNPIGAHKSGRIGEESNGIPANIMPYITKVAVGELPYLNVFGDDYDTLDGTGVRDYIHVVDLAIGHIMAVERLLDKKSGVEYFNLGTGKGYSVLELIEAFSKACGKKIEYRVAPRRAGDVAVSFADVSKAKEVLGWSAKYGIDDMCEDSWRWQKNNPKGYLK